MSRNLFGVFLLLGSALVPPAGALADEWHNVRLNTDLTGQVQNEQQVVVNPTNPLNLVAVWRDFRLGYRQVGYGYTTDGGLTWTNPGLFVDPHYVNDSDPALTVSADGTFYAMLLAYTGSTSQSNGFLMYKSTDGGLSWEDRGFAINGVPGVFEDKELVACDRTDSPFRGRIYCVWDRFYETNIYCVSSGDEGGTWTTARRVSSQSNNQFPTPAVGADGTIYVAWTNFGGYLRIDKSTDGGLTFGADVNITSVYDPHPTVNGGIPSPCAPVIDVDITNGPFRDRLYCVYLDRVHGDFDIFIRHSTDHGATWSPARRINDDPVDNGCDQFHHWMTVDNTGTLTAAWLDRRQDPANLQWHCYMSQSSDGGMTWSPNQQVSTLPSDPGNMRSANLPASEPEVERAARLAQGPKLPGPVRRARAREEAAAGGALPAPDGHDWILAPHQDNTRAGVIGEYIGVAAWDGYATLVWTDTRGGDQDTYAAIDETITAVDSEAATAPFRVLIAGPNPSRGPVGLAYRVAADGWVDLRVFDVRGRLVRTLVSRNLRAGGHRFLWDTTDQSGRKVPPGAYFVRFHAPGLDEETAAIRILP